MRTRAFMGVPAAILAAVIVAGCSTGDNQATDSAGMAAAPADSSGGMGHVMAQMKTADGRDLGTLTLADGNGGITLTGTLTGLPPGQHAIHLHTIGACQPAFDAAGGHWNPTNKEHGSQNPNGPHLGDTGNITVGADSSVTVNVTTPGGSLHGENMLMDADGAAVVVHAGADDMKSNPAGNAGNRIACGIVSGM